MSAIRDFVMDEPLFDTHDHQRGFTHIEKDKDKLDYQAFLGYATADLATAAGGSPDTSTPDSFFKLWAFVRTTGYGQGTELACRAVTGLHFTRENVPAIAKALHKLVAGQSGADIYRKLYTLANIRWAINDEFWEDLPRSFVTPQAEHPAFFRHVLRHEGIILLQNRQQVLDLEKPLGAALQRLSDLNRALDEHAGKAKAGGKLAAIKFALAYHCPLHFPPAAYADAETVFEEIMQGRAPDTLPLRSYLFHRAVQRARELDLPVQIHIGYLAGNWGDLTCGDPAPLVPVFQRYRGVRFDLFHAGWPYWEFLGALGKEFPNVYLDLCWAWAMNPVGTRRVLGEWLSVVPHNRIFGFGADTCDPYSMVGYALQARAGIADVLDLKVKSGEYDKATAKSVARRIMHENARALYPME